MTTSGNGGYKSAVRGEGHGSDHCWLLLGSNQVGSDAERKATHYVCRGCGHMFAHRYAAIRDIFEAMRSENVPGVCARPAPGARGDAEHP